VARRDHRVERSASGYPDRTLILKEILRSISHSQLALSVAGLGGLAAAPLDKGIGEATRGLASNVCGAIGKPRNHINVGRRSMMRPLHPVRRTEGVIRQGTRRSLRPNPTSARCKISPRLQTPSAVSAIARLGQAQPPRRGPPVGCAAQEPSVRRRAGQQGTGPSRRSNGLDSGRVGSGRIRAGYSRLPRPRRSPSFFNRGKKAVLGTASLGTASGIGGGSARVIGAASEDGQSGLETVKARFD
jgi:hypothetical protein